MEAMKYKSVHNISCAQAVKKIQNDQGNKIIDGNINEQEITSKGTD